VTSRYSVHLFYNVSPRGQDAASIGHHYRNTNVASNWVGSVDSVGIDEQVSVDRNSRKKEMIDDYTKETYQDWLTIHGTNFKRKLENETAFDGIVKIYSIKTDDDKINKILDGLFFGKLGEPTDNGILLRLFKNKDSWPKTSLTHLNIRDGELTVIKESKSSYETWTVIDSGHGQFQVQLSPTETIKFTDI
jgi:hypothetical protein